MTCCIMATRLRTMLPHGGIPPPEEAGPIPNRPSFDMKGGRRRRHSYGQQVESRRNLWREVDRIWGGDPLADQ